LLAVDNETQSKRQLKKEDEIERRTTAALELMYQRRPWHVADDGPNMKK